MHRGTDAAVSDKIRRIYQLDYTKETDQPREIHSNYIYPVVVYNSRDITVLYKYLMGLNLASASSFGTQCGQH